MSEGRTGRADTPPAAELRAVEAIHGLGAVLRSRGYAAETITERLGIDASRGIRSDEVPVHLRRLHHCDALDDLIRLFLLNAPLTLEEAQAALAPVSIADLEHVGILGEEGSAVRSLLRMVPYRGMLFAYDVHQPGSLQQDSVLGWTASARTLASMTVRRPVESALDMGTGSGVQALLAAGHAERVVAVDVNPRALWLTTLNCHLNGISNVECRQGDLFQPVADERFDLIVTNPPFVISPAHDYLFRDAGYERDELSKAVVSGAAAALNEGGFAHVMCNWIVRLDEPWWEPVAAWVDGSGCDVLLLHYDTLDPIRYAAGWNEDAASDRDRFATILDSWLSYYDRHGIEAIAMGAVILRRRTSDEHWVVRSELAKGPSGWGGTQVERIFAAQDDRAWVEDDQALLSRAFLPVSGHRLDQVLTFHDGAYTAEDAAILLDDGLGVRNRVPPEALHVLLRMDGSLPLRQLVRETAEDTGLDPDALSARVVESVRDLFQLGFLESRHRVDLRAVAD